MVTITMPEVLAFAQNAKAAKTPKAKVKATLYNANLAIMLALSRESSIQLNLDGHYPKTVKAVNWAVLVDTLPNDTDLKLRTKLELLAQSAVRAYTHK